MCGPAGQAAPGLLASRASESCDLPISLLAKCLSSFVPLCNKIPEAESFINKTNWFFSFGFGFVRDLGPGEFSEMPAVFVV